MFNDKKLLPVCSRREQRSVRNESSFVQGVFGLLTPRMIESSGFEPPLLLYYFYPLDEATVAVHRRITDFKKLSSKMKVNTKETALLSVSRR